MSYGQPNGPHKPGVHPAGFPVPRVPLPHFPGGPHSQPYAIPTRGAVHGPIGAVPQVPQPGSRGFGAGRGNAGGPIGGHLSHQHGSQQAIGSLGSPFNFPALDNPNSQPSVGAPLSQTGLMTQVFLAFPHPTTPPTTHPPPPPHPTPLPFSYTFLSLR